jgi:hypothetical protein
MTAKAITAATPRPRNSSVLPAIFIAVRSSGLARCNKYGVGSRSGDRRAVVGKGADARQTAIRRPGHGGANQHESQGKDDAKGCRRCPPFFVMRRAVNCIELKSLNFWKIVSSGCGDETI